MLFTFPFSIPGFPGLDSGFWTVTTVSDIVKVVGELTITNIRRNIVILKTVRY